MSCFYPKIWGKNWTHKNGTRPFFTPPSRIMNVVKQGTNKISNVIV